MENKKIEIYSLENDNYKVQILPDRGCKITSFMYKENKFEVFHQPQHEYENLEEKYPKGVAGDLFMNYDTSGCDDCIPTIDPCEVSFAENKLHDHGEVWYKEFEIISKDNNHLKAKTMLTNMPIEFTKNTILEEDGIKIEYKAVNKGSKECGFMWSLHDLTVLTEGSYLEMPLPFSIINVQNDDKWDFDIRSLSELEKDMTYKFYYDKKISEGKASVVYPKENMKYTVKFDLDTVPYLGVWITTGGYKNEINLAIEPSTSYYDSLDKAIENGTAVMLKANEEFAWDIKLNLEKLK